MYKVENKDWGIRLVLGGSVDADEMARWLEEVSGIIAAKQGEFFVFVDMRTLIPLSQEAQALISQGQEMARRQGMVRSVVILSSPVIAAQFRRIGGETRIGRWERYIDASQVPNWEEVGMNWLLHAVDPDQVPQSTRPG